MKNKNSTTRRTSLTGAFSVCFVIGFLCFLLTWDATVAYSGTKGFLIGCAVSYLGFVLLYFLARTRRNKSESAVKSARKIVIENSDDGDKVIRITIPKKLLNS